MKYEEIIEDVGGCGLYQKLLLSLLYLIPVFGGLQIGCLVFIVPEIQHRCAIPDLPNDTYGVQDTGHIDLITDYIPQYMEDGERKYSNCYLYSNETLDGNKTMHECNSWVYDKSQYQTSVTSDLDLVCDRAMFTSHVKTAYFVGAFTVFMIGGWLSDKIGRKITLVCCILLQGISTLVCTEVTNVYLFLFARVLSAIGGAGSFGTLLVFVTEITSMKYRSRLAMSTQLAFSFAFLFISLIAYFIREWKVLMILISAPLIPLALLTMWLVPESPRWLMSVKREEQAGKILNKMAKINKSNFRYQPEQEIEVSNSSVGTVKVWKIFTVRTLLKRTLIMMFAWTTVIFVYYGLTLNLGALVGNVYLNLFLNSLVEISVVLFAVFFVDRFGRKKLTFSFMVTSGINGMLTIFPYLYASTDQYWTITALTTFSRMCIPGAISVLCLYTCELYPTCIRNSSVGFLAGFARFGGVLSPYIMNLSTLAPGRVGKSLPLMVMGITCFVSGSLIIFLPETTNKPMQDTLDEEIKRKYTNNSKERELDEIVELNAVEGNLYKNKEINKDSFQTS